MFFFFVTTNQFEETFFFLCYSVDYYTIDCLVRKQICACSSKLGNILNISSITEYKRVLSNQKQSNEFGSYGVAEKKVHKYE